MQSFRSITSWAAAFSQLEHVFCCGLPALFSALSLLSGLGFMIAMPIWLQDFRHTMHNYEVPLIVTAGLITAIGWIFHFLSLQMDCRASGCCHEPCEPKKNRSSKVLMFATVLFAFNIFIFMTIDGCH